jgi:hypothetical protein
MADIPAPRHTYAKLAFDATYRGLFSVIEHVDKKFLRDHFGENHRGNLYKTGCRDIRCASLAYRTGPDGDDSGSQYFIPGAAERTYRLQTNKNNPGASTYDDLPVLSGPSTAPGCGAARSGSIRTPSASRWTA